MEGQQTTGKGLSLNLSASWWGATAGRAVRNGRPGSPALPGSWPLSRSERNRALPLSPQAGEMDPASSRGENLLLRGEAFIPRRVAAGAPNSQDRPRSVPIAGWERPRTDATDIVTPCHWPDPPWSPRRCATHRGSARL